MTLRSNAAIVGTSESPTRGLLEDFSLTWSVCSHPWLPGDKLMLPISRSGPNLAGPTNDPSCSSLSPLRAPRVLRGQTHPLTAALMCPIIENISLSDPNRSYQLNDRLPTRTPTRPRPPEVQRHHPRRNRRRTRPRPILHQRHVRRRLQVPGWTLELHARYPLLGDGIPHLSLRRTRPLLLRLRPRTIRPRRRQR